MTALGSFGGNGKSGLGNLQNNLKKGLGFSEFGIQSQDTIDSLGNTVDHNNAVVIGRRLSSKIYLRYSIGLIVPVNTLEIEYLINHKWSLQSTSSSLGNGLDLIYTVQRN